MYNINAIKKLSAKELEKGGAGNDSWHNKYKDSSYIYIGGLNYGLSEGDIIVAFSQWGSPVDINLVRDPKTGKSKGFAFLAYEDQRSTILAVDNANGMNLAHKTIRVDHVLDYKAPEKWSKKILSETGEEVEELIPYEATGAEGGGIGVYGILDEPASAAKDFDLELSGPGVQNGESVEAGEIISGAVENPRNRFLRTQLEGGAAANMRTHLRDSQRA